MSIKNQVNNIFHTILHNQGDILVVNNAISKSLYDLSLSELGNYVFVDQETVEKQKISYGLTIVNDPMFLINNISRIKNMYSNKVIFFHENLFVNLKKEDQYLLYNQIKNYPLFSFVPNMPIREINFIKYGIKPSASRVSPDRTIDILILYSSEKKQEDMLLNAIKRKFPQLNTEILNIANVASIENCNSILNNTKVCIDLSSYYNVLYSVSCGCFGITNRTSYDPKFINTVDSIDNIFSILQTLLNNHNEDYIKDANKYIEMNYSYDMFESNLKSIITQFSNSTILL